MTGHIKFQGQRPLSLLEEINAPRMKRRFGQPHESFSWSIMSSKARTTFYSLTLAAAVLETAFGFLAAFTVQVSLYMWIFTLMSGIASGITWIWVSVLLSYNNRPLSSHTLARASTHFISFVVFTAAWLAISIMITTQLPAECNFETSYDGLVYAWCAFSSVALAFSWLTCIFSAVSTLLVHRASRIFRSGAGLAGNVAQSDKGEVIVELLP
ncbi:hypothetical protein Hypma_001845 [Hypsizygus marmoreus]|uniref:MARVEL domain-containing protein n=1 Tax=Hypsizygus marmoreus TaxID=39966 RepID=A0A369JCN4_HYPMA|nr:hypothetical protein Hypma_001845 [Hypsizygus marmoreus]